MTRFLRFIVEETLAGYVDELKETTIGVAVFDRPPITIPASTQLFASKRDGSARNCLSIMRRTAGKTPFSFNCRAAAMLRLSASGMGWKFPFPSKGLVRLRRVCPRFMSTRRAGRYPAGVSERSQSQPVSRRRRVVVRLALTLVGLAVVAAGIDALISTKAGATKERDSICGV